jgi:asparagine synthase (glutamine-hydrolysing)
MLNRLNEIDHIESFIGIHTSGKQRYNLKFIRALLNCQTKKSILLHNRDDYFLCLNSREKEDPETFQLIQVDPKITAFFYGEMYNFGELCAACSIGNADWSNISFSALCCILYKKYGLRFAQKINGIFSIVLIDENKKQVCLFADRFGSARPIYYHISDKMIFSNQLKLLIKIPEINKVIDEQSMALFLKYSYVPSPRTIIRGVFKLGPGEMIIYKDGHMTNQRYVQFSPDSRLFLGEHNAAEQYFEVLRTSIKKKATGLDRKRIGFFLSGGLDSSANVALASGSGLKGFKTFGIGFEDPKIDERPYARLVADHFGAPFHEYVFDGSEIEDLPSMVWHLDEPFMENGLFLTYAGFKAAKGNVDLIVAGDGADQLFGTGGFADGRPIALRLILERLYLRAILDKGRKHLLSSSFYRDTPLFKAKVMLDRSVDLNDWFFWGFDETELAKLCHFSINKDLTCFSNDLRQVPKTLSAYYHHALIHQDLEHYAFQNILFKSFRMAEMFGIKLREAYLDKEVIEFVLSTDFSLKTKGSLWDFLRGKRITKYLHQLSMVGVLPWKAICKPKQGGFVPMTYLLKNALVRRKVFDYLTHSSPLNMYLDVRFLKFFFRNYEQSLLKTPYWQSHWEARANQIMNILALSLWYEIFVKGKHINPPKTRLTEFIC